MKSVLLIVSFITLMMLQFETARLVLNSKTVLIQVQLVGEKQEAAEKEIEQNRVQTVEAKG